MTSPSPGRGSQVVYAGSGSQRASRGGYGRTMRENIAYKEYLEQTGDASDGNSADGTTVTGLPPYDVQYTRTGSDLTIINLPDLPTSPDGLEIGDIWVNGGVLMVVMPPPDTP